MLAALLTVSTTTDSVWAKQPQNNPVSLENSAQDLQTEEALLAATVPGIAAGLRLQVNIPARELRVIEHETVVATYPVAVGARGFQSPTMTDQVTQLIWNPSWIPPDSPWAAGASPAPPGPNNPLGPVKMPLSGGYRIHGTNKPASIGRAASHGCFRMNNDDAAALGWYLQERMSTQTDPSYRDTYTKNRYRTYVVNLAAPVTVEVIYEAVEIRDRMLVLNQDVYGRVRNWPALIDATLAAHGHEQITIPEPQYRELMQQLKQGNVRIALAELLRLPIAQEHDPLRS